MLQEFHSVFDHFGTLCTNVLRTLLRDYRKNNCYEKFPINLQKASMVDFLFSSAATGLYQNYFPKCIVTKMNSYFFNFSSFFFSCHIVICFLCITNYLKPIQYCQKNYKYRFISLDFYMICKSKKQGLSIYIPLTLKISNIGNILELDFFVEIVILAKNIRGIVQYFLSHYDHEYISG